MKSAKYIFITAAFGVLFASFISCTSEGSDIRESGGFLVDIQGETGSVNAPLKIPEENITFTVDVTAFTPQGKKDESFNGVVRFYITTGELSLTSEKGQLENGELKDFAVQVKLAYGPTHIRVRDEGEKDRPGSFAIGASDTIYFSTPTIRQVQMHEDNKFSSGLTDRSFWSKRQVTIDEGDLVVTAITVDGMYVSDLDETEGYGHIFVYNYDTPIGVSVGDVLSSLSGSVFEFASISTQFTNPSWVKSDKKHDDVTPIMIQGPEIENTSEMEKLESALVCVKNVTIPQFTTNSDYYNSYKQWPIELGDGNYMKVISDGVAKNFDPTKNIGKTIKSVTGNLLQRPKGSDPDPALKTYWIIQLREEEDLVL